MPSSQMDPRIISALRDYFSAFLMSCREKELDQKAEERRHLPEFFLTFSPDASGGSTKAALSVYLSQDHPRYETLDEVVGEHKVFLESCEVPLRCYGPQERTAMYRDFARSGVTYYLHPGALEAIAAFPVSRDAYGRLSLILNWIYGLLLLGTGVLMLADGNDWGFWLALAAALTAVYGLLAWLLNRPALRQPLSALRQQRFGEILSDCQKVSERQLPPALAPEVPASVLSLLTQLPTTRPQSAGTLSEAEWRLGELWDLAHRASAELAKIPESSPVYAKRVREVEMLLRQLLPAFQGDERAQDVSRLNVLYEQAQHHAQALGLELQPIRAADAPEQPEHAAQRLS
ncbi:hypothetical protein GCM10017783_16770 [Deinococcus piscis]|uniref:Uncharacterized protein n=1 Tax=Deinococcus piscis TaxID=394230 RepID=A0ABQ3K9I0_9DEIO|nr:hypothetical protein [Deinococcus piscis]GHG04871.1 hypothetical protein GCM10017783_16770 [Deinococcus piscis]